MQKAIIIQFLLQQQQLLRFRLKIKKSGPTAICCGQAANLILLELSAVELDDLTIVNFHRNFFSFR